MDRHRTLADVESGLGLPLAHVMETQRAMRRLLPDPVDDAIVLRCVELALKAPTGSNAQNWEWVLVKDRKAKETLAARYREAWLLYGTAARLGSSRDRRTRRIVDAVQWQVDHFAEVPVLVVACLRGSRPPLARLPTGAESR